MTLDTLRNDVVRQILGMEDINILKKVRDLIARETSKALSVGTVEEDYVPQTKEEILIGLREACNELKLHREGKLEFKTLEEVLDELPD